MNPVHLCTYSVVHFLPAFLASSSPFQQLRWLDTYLQEESASGEQSEEDQDSDEQGDRQDDGDDNADKDPDSPMDGGQQVPQGTKRKRADNVDEPEPRRMPRRERVRGFLCLPA